MSPARSCLAAPSRRLAASASAASVLAALAAVVCILALQASAAAAATLDGPLVPYIVNGQESAIEQVPWQVLVLLIDRKSNVEATCGGSILDASHILTAAHCVDEEGTTSKYPIGDIFVVAGASDVHEAVEETAPPGSQVRELSAVRTHPYYSVSPIRDDVAVLTLSEALDLSGPRAKAIGLVPTGATPAPGTTLSVSGYGKESGQEGVEPNYKLYSTSLTAVSSDACRAEVGSASAVLLCAVGAASSTCQGDSGGPLTQGSPAAEVGTVDFGPKGCPTGQPDGFTNLAAPEVRAFVEGSEAPPMAAQPLSPPALKTVGVTPVDFSPLTCESGAWSGSPAITYTFQVENASAQVLQSGPSNVFVPPASLVGAPLVCIVQASNPGGVATNRSGTTPAIAPDAAPPVASITAVRCHAQTCTLSLLAGDPNAVALSIRASAAYRVTAKCPRKGKRRSRGRQPVCHKSHTVNMPVSAISGGSFKAGASRLPYGERITFALAVANAAGLRPLSAATRSTTLHPPKRKKKPKRR
jgi:Trypsin